MKHTLPLLCGLLASVVLFGAGSATAADDAPLTKERLLEIVANPDAFHRARELGRILPEAGPEALPAVKEVLEDAGDLQLGGTEFGLLMRYWSIHDPAGAAYYAGTDCPRGYRVTAIHETLRHYARIDPQGALRDVGQLTKAQGDWGTAAQIALVRGWVESGEGGIEEYIRNLGPGIERQRALKAYSTALLHTQGVEKAVAWAEGVAEPDSFYKLEVNRAMGAALVPFSTEAAVRLCSAHCEGEHGRNLRTRIANRWSREDPEAAMLWLKEDPGQDTKLSVRVVYAKWVAADREGAIAWVGGQRGADGNLPEWLKPVIPVHAQAVAEEDPVAGLEWARRIEEEQMRESILMEVARLWRERDSAAADAWMDETDELSAESIAKVRTPGRGWRSGKKLEEQKRSAN